MKKVVAIVVLLVAMMNLCACTSKEERALQEANKRVEQAQKDYENAMNNYDDFKNDVDAYYDALDRVNSLK